MYDIVNALIATKNKDKAIEDALYHIYVEFYKDQPDRKIYSRKEVRYKKEYEAYYLSVRKDVDIYGHAVMFLNGRNSNELYGVYSRAMALVKGEFDHVDTHDFDKIPIDNLISYLRKQKIDKII